MLSDLPASASPDAGTTTPDGADAAEQMAAATESLRAKLSMLQGDGPPVDPYPA